MNGKNIPGRPGRLRDRAECRVSTQAGACRAVGSSSFLWLSSLLPPPRSKGFVECELSDIPPQVPPWSEWVAQLAGGRVEMLLGWLPEGRGCTGVIRLGHPLGAEQQGLLLGCRPWGTDWGQL